MPLKHATKFSPHRTAFETAERAGFQFAEFYLNRDLLTQWEKIAALANEFPLHYALHFPNRGDLDEQSLDHAVALYRSLRCQAMVIHQPMFRQHHEQLRRRHGEIRLAVENHRLAPAELEQWATENDWLTLDVEHLWKFTYEDMPLNAFLERLKSLMANIADKVVHVHLPGYLPGYDEHRPQYCAREMVLPVFSILAEHGFDGLVVSEVNVEFQNPLELRMDVLLCDRWRELQETTQS